MGAICYVDFYFVINQICHILRCSVHFCDIFFHRIHSENCFSPYPFSQNYFSYFLTIYNIFNGSLKLILLKKTCLNFITNSLYNPKIFCQDIQIFNYFIHMIEFGNVGKILRKKDLYFLIWIVLI